MSTRRKYNLKDIRDVDTPVMLKGGGEKTLPAKRPLLVLFFMEGCPHCQSNKPAWDEAKKKLKGGVATAEIESADVPMGESVNGFPTMKYYSATGAVKEISGSQPNGGAILSQLGVPASSTTGGRSRRVRNRGTRKLRHRTLRSYITL